ncbi:hypothetical protein [Nonomuraea africana]|uniref:Uncharacterized protein n=1 Tax=Nonomuraea africana TaxID=46171 RepID=A0ABR9KJM3_9ACTN|nr:hypothetical protein [Nonomuraea africana]MBE1562224.1 hypothetical protein [Nonomuraea africana]
MAKAFWIDQELDRDRDGRYGAHVRKHVEEFADSFGDIAPVTFACVAWRMAVPPAMSPGHVRWDRRILEASCVRNTWDGTLTAEVRMVSPLPEQLTSSREWWRDRGWRGWQEIFGQFVEPTQEDLTRGPFVRASLLVQAPIPLEELPPAPQGPHDGVEEAAHRALAVLVKELNALLAPVLDRF